MASVDQKSPSPYPSPGVPGEGTGNPFLLRCLLYVLIGAYLIGMGGWAFSAGMHLRDDIWVQSRSIRFLYDISNGMNWGNKALRTAERVANFDEAKRSGDKSTPALHVVANPTSPKQRALTFWEVLRGEDQLYQDLAVVSTPDADFRLDYPPFRLLSMTLWTWHVQASAANETWPGRWSLKYSATGDPGVLFNEDVARPMLLANAYSVVVAAAAVFFLVWLWAYRGGRPALPGKRTGWTAWFAPEKRLVPWKPLALTRWETWLAFVPFCLAMWAFFQAVLIAETPYPSPPPAIAFEGRPAVTISNKGVLSAAIPVRIDAQGDTARWYIEWGVTSAYGYKSTARDTDEIDQTTVDLTGLPANSTIHYRLSASNERGVTHGNDEVFRTPAAVASAPTQLPPMPSRQIYGAVWLDWSQWTVVAVFLVLMCVSLHYLPTPHRGWAAGLVAALFVWFDPSILSDAHVWPQWDVWVLPPILLATLMASLDWWFVAGLIMGVGVMFKGQTLVGGPILAVWPLLAGRWGKLGRLVIGFVFSAGVALSPWVVLGNQPPVWTAGALRWIPSVMAAALIAGALSYYRPPVIRRAAGLWNAMAAEWNRKPLADAGISPSLGNPGEGRGGGSGEIVIPEHNPHPSPPPAYRERGSERSEGPEGSKGSGGVSVSIRELIILCSSLLLGITLSTLLIFRRWPSDGEIPRKDGVLLLLGILLPPWLLPRRSLGVWLAAILAASIWMSAYLYHGDWTWKTVGFEYGTRAHPVMALGGSTGNLPEILASRFNWAIEDQALTLHLPDLADALHLAKRGADGKITGWVHTAGLDGTGLELNIRQTLIMVFVVVLLLCGFAAALQSRRNDPRFLASLAALWVLFPNILCQMAQRYQMWGAAITSVLIAISPGMTFLHVICALLAAAMISMNALNSDPTRSPRIHEFIQSFSPDDGWIMLTIGLIILYVALAPGRRPDADELGR